jgi:arylsulfatase A-like enzyme
MASAPTSFSYHARSAGKGFCWQKAFSFIKWGTGSTCKFQHNFRKQTGQTCILHHPILVSGVERRALRELGRHSPNQHPFSFRLSATRIPVNLRSRTERMHLLHRLTPLFLSLAVLTPIGAPPARAQEARPSKPNFVFILIDDMGWKDVGCNGSTFYQTPNIDHLAAQGMRFTNGYAACPVCSPTRASILTGKYPARLHLTDWLPGRADRPSQKLLRPKFRQYLPLEEVTIAKALKPLGYVSASIGKWHLGGKPYYPEPHGFDLNVGGTERGSPPSYFFPYQNANFSIPTLPGGRQGDYLTDRLTQEAEKFIEQNQGKPFFLYLAHYAVHIPLQAKKDMISKYQTKAKPGAEQNNPIYATMVESVDESVGRVMRRLDELRIADRTVVFFTSDNGGLSVKEGPNTPSTSNAPLRAGKGYLYEGGIREPLLIRWPGRTKPGCVCNVPVSSVDFYPTILEMAGLSVPPCDGVSLIPLLQQAGSLKRDALYWHYPHYSNQGGKPGGAIRKEHYKLIEFYEDGRLELYNLKDDIGEKTNLVSHMPQKANEMRDMLHAWRKAVDAQMPTPNPDYKP